MSEQLNDTITYLSERLDSNVVLIMFVITTAISIVYLFVISFVIAQMEKNYFIRKDKTLGTLNKKTISSSSWYKFAFVLKFVKIVAGLLLLVCGILMLILPGQGVITILIGLSLIPFPGKQRIVMYLLSRKSVRYSLNWIRLKANKEPFLFDSGGDDPTG